MIGKNTEDLIWAAFISAFLFLSIVGFAALIGVGGFMWGLW